MRNRSTGVMRIAVVSFLFFSFASCVDKAHVTNAKEKADKYYDWMKQDKIDSIFTLLSNNGFLEGDSIEIADELKKTKANGAIVSCDYYGNTQETKLMNGKKATFVTVKYKVKYSNGTTQNEQFKFITDDENTDVLCGMEMGDIEE